MNHKFSEPKAGFGAIEHIYDKRIKSEVVKVSNTGNTIWIQQNHPKASIKKCTLRKDGKYRTIGEYGWLVEIINEE